MNTMKKWLVVGLIGLSSAAVSLASPVVFNTPENFVPDNGVGNFATWDAQAGGPWTDWAGDQNAFQANGFTVANGSDLYYTGGMVMPNATTLGGWTLDLTGANPGNYYQDWTGAKSITFDVTGAPLTYTYLNLQTLHELSGFDNSPTLWQFSVGNGLTMTTDQFDPSLQHVVVDLSKGFGANGIWTVDMATTLRYLYSMELYVENNNVGDGYSYITNFQVSDQAPLGVPEPETVWMILAVLASLGVTFRRQLTSLVTRA